MLEVENAQLFKLWSDYNIPFYSSSYMPTNLYPYTLVSFLFLLRSHFN